MRTSKKLLSVFLTMIMTFSLMLGGLTTAFAAAGDPGADKAVSSITGSNILLVGDYAFDLNSNEYNLNNFVIAAKTAYLNPNTSKYEVYFKVGDIWYDIVPNSTILTLIPDSSKINGDYLII